MYNVTFWKDRDGRERARISFSDPHWKAEPCQVPPQLQFTSPPSSSQLEAWEAVLGSRREAFRCRSCGGVPNPPFNLVELSDTTTGEPRYARPCSECPNYP